MQKLITPVVDKNKLAKKALLVIISVLDGSTVMMIDKKTVKAVRVPQNKEKRYELRSFIIDSF